MAALLEKNSYDFSELFAAVHEKLKARNTAGGGKEMLRLRIYEKLHILVAQGLVKRWRKDTPPSANPLRVRIDEMAEAKARFQALARFGVAHRMSSG